MKFLLQELAVAARGKLLTDSQSTGARNHTFSFDTRTIRPGQVFVALQGEQTDGHDYLAQALRKGAGGLIVSDAQRMAAISRELSPQNNTGDPASPFVIQVDDTLSALQSIASACRQKHPIPLIAVTGSNGKTTVKDMTASILRIPYGDRVLQSEKSFNNHIGLPLTLANMTEHHGIAVVEIGMNAPGEIRHLAGIARPDVGMVTNIAQAHAGYFDSVEAIMRAKMELIEMLPERGVAILNRDDKLFEKMLAFPGAKMEVVTYGIRRQGENVDSPSASAAFQRPTVTAEKIACSQAATYSFELITPTGKIPIGLNIPGRHNISNALAAVANVLSVDRKTAEVSLQALKEGLESFQASPMRMQISRHQGITIINDAYNANPASMQSALRTLKSMACQGKKIAVLGDMLELGELSRSAHRQAGKLSAEAPVDVLLLLGEYARETAQAAQESGMAASQVIIADSHARIAAELANRVHAGDMVLCKGSRGMIMEKVIEQFLELLGV